MIKIRSIKNSDNGVVGIIVALLLIGLVISAISFVQAVFVPKWMAEREAEHMEEVAKQFSQFKFATDTLSLTENTFSSISCPITLGCKEMPFFFSSRSYGDLEILPDDYRMNFTNKEGANYTRSLDSVKYTSHNNYYINQNYVFENGAIILNQDSGDTIKIAPNIQVVPGNIPIIKIYSTSFNEVGGKTVASGYGTYPVQTKKSRSEDAPNFGAIKNLTIYNSHIEAWKKFLNSTFSKSLILNFTINDTADGNALKIEFFEGDGFRLPEVELYITTIAVKITPGWIE